MTGQQCPLKKQSTSTAPIESATPGPASLTIPAATRRSHQTSRSARTCSRARSQVSLYASEVAASDPHQLKSHQEHSVMYPVDMLKVRDSTRTGDQARYLTDDWQTRMQVINPGPSATYTSSIANALVTVSRVEGFRSLWRGLPSVVLGAGTCSRIDMVQGARLTVTQGPRTPYTLPPTKPQNTLSAETRERTTSTILLLQVRNVLEIWVNLHR
jgi:hypothetical protein